MGRATLAEKESMMSLHPHLPAPVPADTAATARAAFRRGNAYMQLRDTLGPLITDRALLALYSHEGRPVLSPGTLATVTVLQYAEGLSDAQAAEAVRSRIDWKYLLGLPLADAGFDSSVLSEFRTRLVEQGAEAQLLTLLLERFREAGMVRAGGTQRTDATQVLAAVRDLNRLEVVRETVRAALNALAVAAPTWLVAHADPAWTERYDDAWGGPGRRLTERQRDRLLLVIGQDGVTLLTAVAAARDETTWSWLERIPAIATLRRVWEQQYRQEGDRLIWREAADLPAAADLVCSPYDVEARYSEKRGTGWTGYKAHYTESCDPDQPHLITQVTTTPATTPDVLVTDAIQEDLVTQDLTPATQLVDSGYLATVTLQSSADRGIRVVGPLERESSWQTRAGKGYGREAFTLDWEAKEATCPQGKRSSSWRSTTTRGGAAAIQVHFKVADCGVCPVREACTRADRRSLSFPPQPLYALRQEALAQQHTAAFRTEYRQRAGIEGTISEAIRTAGLRHARYQGAARTHLQHVLIATGMNLRRVAAFLQGRPRAATRRPAFARVLAAASP